MSVLESEFIKISTTDLQKTMKFYLNLGFETILKTFDRNANEQVAYLQFKNIIIKSNENLNVKDRKSVV